MTTTAKNTTPGNPGALGGSQGRPRGLQRDLVFQPSRWQNILWRDTLGRVKVITPGVEQLYQRLDRYESGSSFPREAFGRLYGDPGQLEDVLPEDGWAKAAHEALDQLPEWVELQERCQGDETWAGVTAMAISQAAVKACPEPTEQEQDVRDKRDRLQGLEGAQAMGLEIADEAIDEAKADLQGAIDSLEAGPGRDMSKMRQEMRRAIAGASDEIDRVEDAQSALGGGHSREGAGQDRKGDTAEKIKLAEMMRDNSKLQRIVEMAGRIRRIHARVKETKGSAPTDIHSITRGGDVSRILPQEFAALMQTGALRTDFFRKIVEGEALQYDLKGKEKKGKGPIIVCVDESGSMMGAKNEWAKGVALAMLSVADKEGRGWGLIRYTTSVEGSCRQQPKTHRDLTSIATELSAFASGGTLWEPALDLAANWITEDRGYGLTDADVIFITDGMCSVESEWVAEFRAKMDLAEANVYGVVIGESGDWKSRMPFCDNVVTLDNMRSEEAFEIVLEGV